MAIDDGAMVVVEMLTGCAVVVVAGAAAGAEVVVVIAARGEGSAATRIQHFTPRLRPRAPSTPTELVIPGLEMNCREIRLSTPYPYSDPSFGMKRSNPESASAPATIF